MTLHGEILGNVVRESPTRLVKATGGRWPKKRNVWRVRRKGTAVEGIVRPNGHRKHLWWVK
jgi:hypothetical protein